MIELHQMKHFLTAVIHCLITHRILFRLYYGNEHVHAHVLKKETYHQKEKLICIYIATLQRLPISSGRLLHRHGEANKRLHTYLINCPEKQFQIRNIWRWCACHVQLNRHEAPTMSRLPPHKHVSTLNTWTSL